MKALDLFAGPGGWDVGAAELGIYPLGIEWDEAACQTRRAAGHLTLRADVAKLDPVALVQNGFVYVEAEDEHGERDLVLDWARSDRGSLDLLIASPPCQAWSMAGKRLGEKDKDLVYEATRYLAAGRDTRAELRERCEDERSMLVVEALRWALALEPTYIAFEQVPPVLDYWRFVSGVLEDYGYSTWTGILKAERYGVPQTRERAILMASREGAVQPPAPTHQRYVPGEPQWEAPMVSLEGELLPWVSMAEALGWAEDEGTGSATAYGAGMVERHGERPIRTADKPGPVVTEKTQSWTREIDVPAPTVTSGGTSTGGAEVFGRGGRERIQWAYDRRQGRTKPSGERVPVPLRAAGEPAPTPGADGLSKGRDVWRMAKKEDRPERKAQGAGNQPRPVDTPAATIDTRVDLATWVTEGDANTSQPPACGCPWDYVDGGGFCACCEAHLNHADIYALQGDPAVHRYRDCPAWRGRCDDPLRLKGDDWPERRPASTIVGDPRVFQPGGHHGEGEQSQNAVRVTLEEAAILQGFPPDYPFQGSKTKRFEQVGNAVPPPLARAVLQALAPAASANEIPEAA